MTDIEESLDLSWLENYENIQEFQSRELMETIDIYCIYVNLKSEIEKVIKDKYVLSVHEDETFSFLSNDALLHYIQLKKKPDSSSKYKLVDILSYSIDIEPENLPTFIKRDDITSASHFFKAIPFPGVGDIVFEPSLSIFHKTNTLFFIMQEMTLIPEPIKPKSILKLPTSIKKSKSTKKVRISNEPPNINGEELHNKTAKRR
jgi:hypothetical protein